MEELEVVGSQLLFSGEVFADAGRTPYSEGSKFSFFPVVYFSSVAELLRAYERVPRELQLAKRLFLEMQDLGADYEKGLFRLGEATLYVHLSFASGRRYEVGVGVGDEWSTHEQFALTPRGIEEAKVSILRLSEGR